MNGRVQALDRDLTEVVPRDALSRELCVCALWAARSAAGAATSVSNLVDPASSHMLVSKIKPCMSQYKLLYGETANGSLKQL